MEDISRLLNFVSQFIQALKKAGFTKENFQEVISSKGNKIAQDFLKVLSGNYELVQKSFLMKKGIMIVKAFSGNIAELFSENRTGKNKQWHSKNFKKLLKSLETEIETLEIKVKKYVLNKKMSDFNIRNFIGQKKLVHKTKAAAIITLHATMIDEYNDGEANIVYYLDELSELCCAYCRWYVRGERWDCGAGSANGSRWDVGSRIFYPAT